MAVSPPLAGVRIIELAGIGPGPFCGMMLADHGADVIRIDRPGGVQAGVEVDASLDVLLRSRRTLSLDLKSPAGVAVVKRLVGTADGLIEGFRPGVTERLGLGPEALHAINPDLVYGRMTGWGQDGPNAQTVGHDINYIAVSGALDAVGPAGGKPVPPLNLVGDYGGGGLMLAFGMIAGILSVRAGGPGRVVDCAMAEGASLLMAGIWTLNATGDWSAQRGSNLLDGGAPFYDTYETLDGRHVAIGAIEPKFYHRLCQLIGLGDDPDFTNQHDRASWGVMRAKLVRTFKQQTQQAWCALLEQEDVCFAPVIGMTQAPGYAQNVARNAFLNVNGIVQPAPAPRFSGSVPVEPRMWQENSHASALLDELGFDGDEQAALARDGAFGPVAQQQPERYAKRHVG